MALSVSPSDLVVRTVDNEETANTFASYADMVEAIRFRADSSYWERSSLTDQCRAMVGAYTELNRLPWIEHWEIVREQSRDLESSIFNYGRPQPPLHDSLFRKRIVEAQAAQVCWLLGGTKIRDMQRDGIRLSRSLQGSEMEYVPYRGPICVEAREILFQFVEAMPRLRTFRRS